MTTNQSPKIEKVPCNHCNTETKHTVRGQASEDSVLKYSNDYEGWWRTTYTLLQCCGCGTVTLREQDDCSEWEAWDREPPRYYPPRSCRQLPIVHQDLPSDCKQDYEEARNVFTHSPRAAAALLRLCVQKLLRYLGEKGKNINDDIKELVKKGLSVELQQALDCCRVIGNNAVHPGELDINDSPEIAASLFDMINFIVEDRITRPKKIQALYTQLPERARAEIQKRDGTSSS